MSNVVRLAIAAAAVVVVAIVGINLVPGLGGVGGPTATPTPSPLPSLSPTPSPSPSSLAQAWPSGSLARGPVSAALRLCDPRGRPCNPDVTPFSFTLPSSSWASDSRLSGALLLGSATPADSAWLLFLGPIGTISTDPCAGRSTPVGPSVAEMASALATIPGTDAVGPTDVAIGGRPGKLVALTIHSDVPCELSSFWLYGNVSLYPSSLDSKIRIWITELDGAPFIVYADQVGANPGLTQEIQQIVDSIQFE